MDWADYADNVDGVPYSAVDLLAIMTTGKRPDETPFTLPVGNPDAFGRMRVSDPVTLLDVSHIYDKQPLLMEEQTTGTGAGAYDANEACVDMTVDASADEVIRQSRQYAHYQPSKSLLAFVTFDMGTADANVRQRVGLFDDNNGHFVERDGTTINMVRRSKVSGTVVETDVAQASWNIDPMDGTGPSGVTLDLTKAQIYWQDQEWLGVGSVRVGFVIDGAFVPVHVFHHANTGASTYATTATLPVRWEITATGTPGAQRTLKCICAAVVSEGGVEDERAFPFTANTGSSTVGVSTRRPILSIRPEATFNSVVNRATVALESLQLVAGTNNALWELVYNPTLSNDSWAASKDSNSCVDVDTAADGLTGGTTIASGYVVSGAGANEGSIEQALNSKLPVTLDIDGANPIVVSLVCTGVGGTANISGALNWKEIR